jgi:hypothetical protein
MSDYAKASPVLNWPRGRLTLAKDHPHTMIDREIVAQKANGIASHAAPNLHSHRFSPDLIVSLTS